MSEYKRQYRELSDETKQKISQANKNKRKSSWHKAHLYQSLKAYWQSVPSKYGNDNNSVKSSNDNEQ